MPPRPRLRPAREPARAAGALVESPLQLLCTVEAHAAGLTPAGLDALVRSDVPALRAATDAVAGLGLPAGLTLHETGRVRALLSGNSRRVVGDAFSGVDQTRLAARRPEQLIVVDDGLATLELARRLVDGLPLTRVGQRLGPARTRLGRVTGGRLRRLAGEGRLVLFTALPLETDLHASLSALGVVVRTNRFDWLRRQPPGDPPTEPVIVVGTAMVADGLIDPEPYLGWVRGLAEREPVRYLPHRRRRPEVLDRLRRTPGVVVDEPGAPVEVRLRGLGAGQRVVSLPSTSALLLTTILDTRGDAGTTVSPSPVPDAWWTPLATPELREHLSSILVLAARARAQAAPTTDPSETPGDPR